ncbi:MAG: ADP-ribosylglycohydrolase family protein [Acidobacteriota bacterium]|jgi:ADP-ribosylglycohydrolase
MDSRVLKSRFTGALVGFAVGDALGMPTQYLSREQIREYYGKPITTFTRAHAGHASEFLPQGSYTDDTQMLLATAECLVECGRMEPARQADALLSWYLNTVPHRTPMHANEVACKHLATGKAWTRSGVFSGGCGAAIRMPPVGLLYCRNAEALVRAVLDDCVITHTDPRAKAASVAVAYLIARLVQSNEHSSPGDQVLEVADCVHTIDPDMAALLRWVTQIVHLRPEEALFEIGTSSDSLEVVPAAAYCFLKHPRRFAEAVLIAVNAGDASDSIAALTGSFVGALGGLEIIPDHWRDGVEDSKVLMAIAEQLASVAERQDSNSATA